MRIGYFDWDLDDGAVNADAELCAILGTSPADFPGTIDALVAGLAPEDVYGLWTVARQTAASGGPAARRMRSAGRTGGRTCSNSPPAPTRPEAARRAT